PNAPMLGPSYKVILSKIMERAPPLIVVILSDTRFKSALPETVDKEEIIDMIVGASIQTMQLAIISLGLSSSWISVTKDEQERMVELLKVPEHMELKSLVYIGYRESEIRMIETRPMKEVLHYGKYDEKKGMNDQEVREFIVTKTKGYGRT
ncbi:MAG: nitroreductase family protein, partial [Nitrosopumilus sp.]